jgi:sodium transport system permease protein
LNMLALGCVLPFVLHPLSVELSVFLQKHFFLPLPPSVVQQLKTIGDPNQPLWLVLLAFAFAPAICEEIAFRGFILSGFGRSKRTWLAIGLSSLMFGLMHMIPPQVFNASLLGLVLGLIAVRSGSLLPCVAFHFTWNSLAVLHGRWTQLPGAEQINESPWRWLFYFEPGHIHYRWPILVAMTLVGGFLIWRLVKHPGPEQSSKKEEDHEAPSRTPTHAGLESPVKSPREQKPMPTP